ncbi:MAG TPA: PDZ domain-containing protein [Pyrinomonadaceae bacterium]|nr:PDZ domain-containing protein [Pyrinomonadaceae bacterium]
MLRKLSVFILLTAAFSVLAVAQQVQESGKKMEIPFGFVFEGNGSYLGVQTVEVSKENFAKYGLREVRGVAVEKVVENSPAAQAGMQNGDVIVKFNGEEITSTRKLTRLIAEVAPDHQAKVTVLRNGAERDFDVTMGKREMPKFEQGSFNSEDFPQLPEGRILRIPRSPNAPLPPMSGNGNVLILRNGESRQIGVSVSELTKQLAENLGVAGGKGLLVETVKENSPAAKAGLKAGDVIVEADGKEIKNSIELIRALNEKKEGDVNLTIVRDKNRQTINVSPETVKGIQFPAFQNGEEFFPQGNFRIEVPNAPNAPLAPSFPTNFSRPLAPISPIAPLSPRNLLFPSILCL